MVSLQTRVPFVFKHTLLGVHRVTLSRRYRSAIGASRDLLSTRLSASSVKPCSPSKAGCRYGLRPYSSLIGTPLESLGHWCSCGEFMSACDVCSWTILRPAHFISLPPARLRNMHTYPSMPVGH
ncbi:hypothetical protein IG631_03869 [Alternaria alternata]|nr:hypothetical protein IG631_03869 [Alternaria alternata]